MDSEIKACFAKWEASFDALCQYLLDTTTGITAITSEGMAPTSSSSSSSPATSSIEGVVSAELILASAGLSEPSVLVPAIGETPAVALVVPIGRNWVVPACCSTECPTRDSAEPVPVFTPAAVATPLTTTVNVIPSLPVASASDRTLDGQAINGVASMSTSSMVCLPRYPVGTPVLVASLSLFQTKYVLDTRIIYGAALPLAVPDVFLVVLAPAVQLPQPYNDNDGEHGGAPACIPWALTRPWLEPVPPRPPDPWSSSTSSWSDYHSEDSITVQSAVNTVLLCNDMDEASAYVLSDEVLLQDKVPPWPASKLEVLCSVYIHCSKLTRPGFEVSPCLVRIITEQWPSLQGTSGEFSIVLVVIHHFPDSLFSPLHICLQYEIDREKQFNSLGVSLNVLEQFLKNPCIESKEAILSGLISRDNQPEVQPFDHSVPCDVHQYSFSLSQWEIAWQPEVGGECFDIGVHYCYGNVFKGCPLADMAKVMLLHRNYSHINSSKWYTAPHLRPMPWPSFAGLPVLGDVHRVEQRPLIQAYLLQSMIESHIQHDDRNSGCETKSSSYHEITADTLASSRKLIKDKSQKFQNTSAETFFVILGVPVTWPHFLMIQITELFSTDRNCEHNSMLSVDRLLLQRFKPPKSYPLLDDMRHNNSQLMALLNGGEQGCNFHELSLALLSVWRHVQYTKWSEDPVCSFEKSEPPAVHCYEQFQWSSLQLARVFQIWLVTWLLNGLEFSTCCRQASFQGGRDVPRADLSDKILVRCDCYMDFVNQIHGGYDYHLNDAYYFDTVDSDTFYYYNDYHGDSDKTLEVHILNLQKTSKKIISYHEDYHGDPSKTKEVHMPWDPGKSVLCYYRKVRLGDKPNFKEGGMLGTYSIATCTWADLLGCHMGQVRCRLSGAAHYIYTEGGNAQAIQLDQDGTAADLLLPT